jgi:hypothetical protein
VNPKANLTLDRPATYQIRVPGALDERWSDWIGEITVSVECARGGQMVTSLTGRIDQASLHGLLRCLYSRGVPILSVVCIDQAPANEADLLEDRTQVR